MIRTLIGTLVTLLVVTSTAAQPVAVEATPLDVESRVESVSLYLGRASVSRRAEMNLDPGVYELSFRDLPSVIQADTLQARAAGPAQVLSVDYLEQRVNTASLPELAELEEQIAALERRLEDLAGRNGIITSREKMISAINDFATHRGQAETDGRELDLESFRELLAFQTEEREKVLADRLALDALLREAQQELEVLRDERNSLAGSSLIDRRAAVTVVITGAGATSVDLSYLVSGATWSPQYSVRAALDGESVEIEYDAMLSQRTGEDWEDVKLILSTAQPTVAANPPELSPWFIDVIESRPASSPRRQPAMQAPARDDAGGGFGGGGGGAMTEQLARLGRDAEVGGGGPVVTFELPRLVTVPSHGRTQQRTRIATIDADPDFIHVAVPMLTESVYIRGDLTNTSAYQLLTGKAAIFVGQDYVGPTFLSAVAPGGEFEVFFGIDRAVAARRLKVSKETSKTGLFGGGVSTSYEYRLEIDNVAGKTITVELWDRVPVSRHEKIEIKLLDLSFALATDAHYLETSRPLGMLKWDLTVPTAAQGPTAVAISYGVEVNRSKDIKATPLPE